MHINVYTYNMYAFYTLLVKPTYASTVLTKKDRGPRTIVRWPVPRVVSLHFFANNFPHSFLHHEDVTLGPLTDHTLLMRRSFTRSTGTLFFFQLLTTFLSFFRFVLSFQHIVRGSYYYYYHNTHTFI